MTDKTEALRLKILDAWTESEHEDVRAADYALQGYIIGPLAGVAAQVALREAKNDAIADSIVIPRADLPKVEKRPGTYMIGGYRYTDTPGANWYRNEGLRSLALAECLDAQEPRPMAVGDRVWVVKPERSDGFRAVALAVGDMCEVTHEPDKDGDIRLRRDGAGADCWIAAANVERIEDDRPDQCCGKCPPIVGGGYDCTCEGNPRCQKETNR